MNDRGTTPRESTNAPQADPPGPFMELPARIDPADMTESVPHAPQPELPYEENADLRYPG